LFLFWASKKENTISKSCLVFILLYFFVLIQKSSKKDQGKPDASGRFAGQRTPPVCLLRHSK